MGSMGLKISIGSLDVSVELNDSQTAKWIVSRLPLTSRAELWGEEVYFYIKPQTELETSYAADVVEVGDVAYWPQGPCLCLFFGMTPSSRNGQIMPASTVTVIGRVSGDARILEKTKEGDLIQVEKL